MGTAAECWQAAYETGRVSRLWRNELTIVEPQRVILLG